MCCVFNVFTLSHFTQLYLPFDCDSFEENAAAICDAIYDIEEWLQLQDLQRYKELHTEKKVFSA